MTRLFLDASALVPLQDTRDQWAREMRQISGRLLQVGRPTIVTSNWTFYEALALARRRTHRIAVQLHETVTQGMFVADIDTGIEAEALRRFLAWGDKTASIVDHANLLMAEKLRCEAIITFDTDFEPLVRAAGIRLIGR